MALKTFMIVADLVHYMNFDSTIKVQSVNLSNQAAYCYTLGSVVVRRLLKPFCMQQKWVFFSFSFL